VDHVWSVLCRLSIIDGQRNNVSLIEVMERLSFKGDFEIEQNKIYGVPFPVELVTLWSRSDPDIPEASQARVLMISPKGQVLNEENGHTYSIDLTEYQRFRAIGRFEGLPFVGNGVYKFLIQSFDEEHEQWINETSIPLEIVMEIP
jgi:hypothetical protein